jgi:hypothetical protein
MNHETFPRFAASDGTGYTVRREDRCYVVVRMAADEGATRAAATTVGGPFESRHAAVAAAQGCARRGERGA